MRLPRTRLRDLINANPTGVTFLRAPAGAGKSVLLEMLAEDKRAGVCRSHRPKIGDVANGCLLWDVPVHSRSFRIPTAVVEAAYFVVIACRPGQRIAGLARQMLHLGSLAIGSSDLALTQDEVSDLPVEIARIFIDEYAGWPVFLPLARLSDEILCIEYLQESYLAHLSPAQIAELSLFLAGASTRSGTKWTELLPPFLGKNLGNQCTPMRLLALAVNERLSKLQESDAVIDIASTFEKAGEALSAMAMLIDRGYESHAAQTLERAHGRESIYKSSVDRFQEIVMRFSQETIATNETVLFAVAFALLKQGELRRARHFLSRALGSDYLNPLKALARGSGFSFAARAFRLSLMIFEDLTTNDAMISQLGGFMADCPMDDYGKWAAYYNALLEFESRRRNYREAEAAAARALVCLRKMGGQPLLEFFIHLHKIVLRMVSGDMLLARKAAFEARLTLELTAHDASQEFRMLRLAEACLAYEAGKPRDLIWFVEHEFDRFAAAEIWPSLMHFALHYASQVLIDRFSMTVRPGFLDRLWIHLSEESQFHATMEIRTAIAYQNVNRWTDAASILSAIRMPMDRNWVASAHDDLSRLTRRDEISYVMAWLRDEAHLSTPRADLSQQIDAMTANPKVTNREKVALKIWQSYAAHRRRDNAAARSRLLAALEAATRLGCNGVLSEERIFLSALLNNRRIRSFIETSSEVRAALSILTTSVDSSQTRALRGGLSQREAQTIQLLASGMSNKKIAQTLNVSEATVKFHLGNLFRKLDCKRRSEAICAAKALDWL